MLCKGKKQWNCSTDAVPFLIKHNHCELKLDGILQEDPQMGMCLRKYQRCTLLHAPPTYIKVLAQQELIV